jgi:hypothetical protein
VEPFPAGWRRVLHRTPFCKTPTCPKIFVLYSTELTVHLTHSAKIELTVFAWKHEQIPKQGENRLCLLNNFANKFGARKETKKDRPNVYSYFLLRFLSFMHKSFFFRGKYLDRPFFHIAESFRLIEPSSSYVLCCRFLY